MNDRMTAAEYQKYILKQEGSERKHSKYNNKKIIYDGIKFDSTKECNRYCELKILLRAKKITNLCRQVKFLLIPGSLIERAMYYVADFVYDEEGQTIVEDVKSDFTRKNSTYIAKRKIFKEKYPDTIFREEI